MSRAPNLPPLPSGWGDSGSPFPPMHSPRPPTAPPVPPLPQGALQREQQLRQQQGAYQTQALPPRIFTTEAPPSFTPGQIIQTAPPRPPPLAPRPAQMAYAAPTPPPHLMRSPSPAMPGAFGGPTHAHMSSPAPPPMHRPASAAPSLGSGGLGPAPHQGMPASRHSMMSATPQASNPVPGFAQLGISSSQSAQELARRRASSSDIPPLKRPSLFPAPVDSPPAGVLNVTLPDLKMLSSVRSKLPPADHLGRLEWSKQVIKFVERTTDGVITDAELKQHVDEAIAIIQSSAASSPPDAAALHLRGDLQASGAFPAYLRKDLKSAFNDFELSARMGYSASWFRIGRDYEVLGDSGRAQDAYSRGMATGDVGCTYRLGMANLLGQIGINVDYAKATQLLRQAADRADLDTPQPSYIWGMLLAGEFSHVDVPKHLLVPTPDPRNPRAPATIESEARRRVERSAYLNFAPAQYKCGWLHEYAQLECPFDPLLSVQYYSLASQGGEIEADMALSKWFLCGAEGCFEKNEDLAFTFADKAAKRDLPAAQFALAYYHEVGVGCERDLALAKKWYQIAADNGNTDAKERLTALEGPTPAALSRKEHETHVDVNLQRKRTEAKMLSDGRAKKAAAAAAGGRASKPDAIKAGSLPSAGPSNSNGAGPSNGAGGGAGGNELSRKKTMRMVEEVAGGRVGRGPGRRIASEAVQSNQAASATGHGKAASSMDHSGRYGPGHQLTETYATPNPSGGPRPPPAGYQASPPRPQPPQQQQQRPPLQGRQSAGVNGRPSAVAASSASGSSGAGSGSAATATTTKTYQSFHEMGFAPKKAQDDKDCCVM